MPADIGRELLLATLGVEERGGPDDEHPLADALQRLNRGEWAAGLAAALRAAWPATASGSVAPESVPDWFEALQHHLQQVLPGSSSSDSSAGCSGSQPAGAAPADALLLAAVASLLLFLQSNLTGPPPTGLPESPFDLLTAADAAASLAASSQGGGAASTERPGADAGGSGGDFGRDSTTPADRCVGWARRVLFPQPQAFMPVSHIHSTPATVCQPP